MPVLLLPLLAAFFLEHRPQKKILYATLGLFAGLIISLFFIFTSGSGTNRPLDVSILNIPGGAVELKHAQDQDGVQNPLITRFYHNKLFFYGRHFATSYFQHFDGDFLFVKNGLPIRYKVPWSGNIFPLEIPFLLFGFAVLLTEGIKARRYIYLIPLAWVAIGAIPAGLTWEDIPNIQRSSLMLYGLVMVSAFGLNEALNLLQNKKIRLIFGSIVAVIFLQQILYFNHMYFYHSRIQEPWHRSTAVKELVFLTENLSKEYKKVIMTTDGNNNFIHHLFYTKFDPKTFQEMGSPREREGLQFKNMLFTGNPCPLEGDPELNSTAEPDTVYVVKHDCKLPKNAEVLNVVRHPDGLPAFQIVKLNPAPPLLTR